MEHSSASVVSAPPGLTAITGSVGGLSRTVRVVAERTGAPASSVSSGVTTADVDRQWERPKQKLIEPGQLPGPPTEDVVGQESHMAGWEEIEQWEEFKPVLELCRAGTDSLYHAHSLAMLVGVWTLGGAGFEATFPVIHHKEGERLRSHLGFLSEGKNALGMSDKAGNYWVPVHVAHLMGAVLGATSNIQGADAWSAAFQDLAPAMDRHLPGKRWGNRSCPESTAASLTAGEVRGFVEAALAGWANNKDNGKEAQKWLRSWLSGV